MSIKQEGHGRVERATWGACKLCREHARARHVSQCCARKRDSRLEPAIMRAVQPRGRGVAASQGPSDEGGRGTPLHAADAYARPTAQGGGARAANAAQQRAAAGCSHRLIERTTTR